ncbi:xanthine phosphoribosyltransferase [Macrococcus equipercicus]|uniref:Xanthine phosphoribosyltransferase n=1 Tax=Macrococcus equipercicus TaxID=69967 RepID=A0A9Q9BVL3_9STAP|nr:xanthine phosphoribosyltransferase [Macrococcus equipercicus]KAA1039494.1 xanthine phosphoribosyltransferase [Macrococcus equipercicus]UTH13778.1 xanthine phosphoribosyltransferase [Macrococcus equipercicus]
MELLQQKVKDEGVVIDGAILKVDAFLNHQIDAHLMKEVGQTFYNYFNKKGVTKILTIEASGIAPAIMAALVFDVPCLFAKKAVPSTLTEAVYATDIHSYTKNKTSHVVISQKFLSADDNVLIIDDFLANGEAALGLYDLVRQAGADCAGVGIVIEKSFQQGAARLKDEGLDVLSLCRIASLENNKVTLVGEE